MPSNCVHSDFIFPFHVIADNYRISGTQGKRLCTFLHHRGVTTRQSSSKIIYTIILLRSVGLSLFANYRLQFLLDRFGRYLELFVSTDIPSRHAFASQFGLSTFLLGKKSEHKNRVTDTCSHPVLHILLTCSLFLSHFTLPSSINFSSVWCHLLPGNYIKKICTVINCVHSPSGSLSTKGAWWRTHDIYHVYIIALKFKM